MNENVGISSVWASSELGSGNELLRKLKDTGIRAYELEYRITYSILNEIIPHIKSEEITILSIHNFFPTPLIKGIPRPSGDAFLLSSKNESERRKAVDETLRTLEYAAQFNAKAVVVHLGHIEMESSFEKFRSYYDEKKVGSKVWKDFYEEMKSEREKLSPYHLESVLKSLEEILVCLPEGVKLGIENRNYFHQIPDFKEMKIICNSFVDEKIGYWHDCGHAKVQENMKWSKTSDWLREFGGRLVGIHLHDCEGYSDHQAPGVGEVDFRELLPFLKNDILKILEIKPSVSLGELKGGLDFLRQIGIL
ncbi:MAG: hypothetical protein D6734_01565 [Candidatus Schekmanbacteria bacterium]|nr:MAG: hypothetical protein D6734_01565 [Candidatus Schekmanbacteria bacterium]